jgi:hypothetical protein
MEIFSTIHPPPLFLSHCRSTFLSTMQPVSAPKYGTHFPSCSLLGITADVKKMSELNSDILQAGWNYVTHCIQWRARKARSGNTYNSHMPSTQAINYIRKIWSEIYMQSVFRKRWLIYVISGSTCSRKINRFQLHGCTCTAPNYTRVYNTTQRFSSYTTN